MKLAGNGPARAEDTPVVEVENLSLDFVRNASARDVLDWRVRVARRHRLGRMVDLSGVEGVPCPSNTTSLATMVIHSTALLF